MFFGLFKRRQKPSRLSPETQSLLVELERFRVRYHGHSAYDGVIIDPIIRDVSKEIIHGNRFTQDLIEKRGWSNQDAAYMILAEYSSGEILSGKMHLRRGVMSDKGKAYLKLFKLCSEKLIASGRLPQADAAESLRDFDNEIARLG